MCLEVNPAASNSHNFFVMKNNNLFQNWRFLPSLHMNNKQQNKREWGIIAIENCGAMNPPIMHVVPDRCLSSELWTSTPGPISSTSQSMLPNIFQFSIFISTILDFSRPIKCANVSHSISHFTTHTLSIQSNPRTHACCLFQSWGQVITTFPLLPFFLSIPTTY